ncbi:MAG: hypothetical protein JWM16_4376 [Verrucomicrobiales bacterium]|nr:hypothetical protein [Verrucomicrobiales bacterium]
MEWECRRNVLNRFIVVGFVGVFILFHENIVWGQKGALRELTTRQPRRHAKILHLRIENAINQKFVLSSTNGLPKLLEAIERAVSEAEGQETRLKNLRRKMEMQKPRELMSQAELHSYFAEPEDLIGKRDRRGLSELRRLGKLAQTSPSPEEREGLLHEMLEVANALYNNHRAPVPRIIEALQVPYSLFDYSYNPICVGDTLASNLSARVKGDSDGGLVDPQGSSFWSRPAAISLQDLFHGFGRSEIPAFQETVWEYAAPKTSYGCCGGFEASSGKQKIKVKFCETTSEPFTARIFGALGFNVEATDYAPWLRMRYDRRLFMEYHQRKDVKTTVAFFGLIPAYTVNMQPRMDPFAAIAAVVMKDGARLTSSQLKEILFKKTRMAHPEELPGNFKKEVEDKIDYLVTRPANVQLKEKGQHSIGPWDFNDPRHQDLREVRGAGLLGAWLGWFDSRYENTRLKVVKRGTETTLKHYFTDLGGGLGQSTGIFTRYSEAPNRFPWFFTSGLKRQGPGRMTIPFRIVGFQPNEDTDAFAAMTPDDARWMARLIGQLTENQILEALVASGFDSAQAKVYAEKLIARRDRMICDLELEAEIPLLRPMGANRKLTYNPTKDGNVTAKLPNGQEIVAHPGALRVENGIVTPWPPPREDLVPWSQLAVLPSSEQPKTAAKQR